MKKELEKVTVLEVKEVAFNKKEINKNFKELYQINIPKIKKIILDNFLLSNGDIANILNANNLKSKTGLNFTAQQVSNFAIFEMNKRTRKTRKNRKPFISDIQDMQNSSILEFQENILNDLENTEIEILPNYEIKDLVFEKEGKFVTDSLMIASTFNRPHDAILKIIRNLECSEEFSLVNFYESDYINERGRNYPKYVLTRDGFSMIAMGLTGSKAIQFKEIYINQFNKMEAFIKSKSESTPIIPVQNNQMEILRQMFLGIDETNKIVLETKEQSNRAEKMAEFAINKIIDMETENKKAKEELEKEVEYSNRLLPDLKIRHKCQNIINNYVASKFLNVSQEDFKSIWNLVDKEFYDRFRINLGIRKNNEAKQTGKKVSRYDIAEELNKIQELYDVISFLFKIEKVG